MPDGSSLLTADRGDIERFVRAMFKYAADGGFVSLRAFRDDADETWRTDLWRMVRIGDGLDRVIDEAVTLATAAAQAGERVVFCPPLCTFKSPDNAKAYNVRQGLVLSVEADKRASEAREKLERLLGPCTCVVASGGTWFDEDGDFDSGSRMHLHWRLREPTTSANNGLLVEARRLAQKLVGADGTAVPLVHPLRWPGSWHRKDAAARCRIIDLRDD